VSLYPLAHGLEERDVLRALRHKERSIETRQSLELGQVLDDMSAAVRVSLQSDHFRVVPITQNDGLFSVAGVVGDDVLYFGYPPAGGVSDLKSGSLQLLGDFGGNAVRTNQDRSTPLTGNTVQDPDALAPKGFQNLGVVDQRTKSVEWGMLLVRRQVVDHFDGTLRSHTETGSFCSSYLHFYLRR
jgi:hypothetical protein